MTYTQTIKKEIQPRVDAWLDDYRNRKDPDFFPYTGTQIYCAPQGGGKTISMVKAILDMKRQYPKAILVSNVNFFGLRPVSFNSLSELQYKIFDTEKVFDPRKEYIFFNDMEQLRTALSGVNNGFHGVIFAIDEIHIYFNSLDSKNIPMEVFAEISQQRKQRKLIIGTSQIFTRMAKPFREQCDHIIICNTIFGFFTTQTAFDGMTLEQDYSGRLIGTIRRRGWFFHTLHLRKSFDTYQKVNSAAYAYENVSKMELGKSKKGLQISVK